MHRVKAVVSINSGVTPEMDFMSGFCDTVFFRFQAMSMLVCRADMGLAAVVRLLESLRSFVLAQEGPV